MPKKSIVADWQGASFAGVDFSRYVTSWEDSRDRRGTIHLYNKRDGGEGEDMGRAPHRAVVNLAYVGPTWRSDFTRLQSAIDANPIGDLVHPVYRTMRAYARSSTARMDLEGSPNLYEVTLTFEESQLDTNLQADATSSTTQGPATKQVSINQAASKFQSAAATFTTASALVSALASAAITYAASAVASTQSLVADATLSQKLAGVLDATNAAIAGVVADPSYAPGLVADPAVEAAELLYDLCTQLDDSIRALRPTLRVFTVPYMMHATNLMRFLYGPLDGPLREAEFLMNNPQLADPGFISGGSQVLVAPPTAQR